MSHYDWLNENFDTFCHKLGMEGSFVGLISAHGDKCYGYDRKWKDAGIPFEHGVAIYLLGSLAPYGDELRDTEHGWVDPGQWVVDNYHRFAEHLPYVEEEE